MKLESIEREIDVRLRRIEHDWEKKFLTINTLWTQVINSVSSVDNKHGALRNWQSHLAGEIEKIEARVADLEAEKLAVK